jgi:hypothetical protein
MSTRGVTPRVHGRPLQRPARRAWPPNVLRRVSPVEPQPSLAREIVGEVIVPALSCSAACAAVAAWLL